MSSVNRARRSSAGHQGGPRGRSRRRHGGQAYAPADAPRYGRPDAGRLARKAHRLRGRRNPGSRQGRGGFDKGTLAAALIGLMRAGQKPAPSADKRTGRRPLSNPSLRRREPATLSLAAPCGDKSPIKTDSSRRLRTLQPPGRGTSGAHQRETGQLAAANRDWRRRRRAGRGGCG